MLPCLGRDRIGAGNGKAPWHTAARLVLAAIIAALALTIASAAHAAMITVTTAADPTEASGTCSLRDAITNANNQNTSGSTNCAPGSGTDTISFNVTGTITLGSTLPTIVSGETLTIQGPSASPGITIDGDGKYEVMLVDSGAMLNIANLTIVNGSFSVGGGIANSGTLTVTNSTFSGNSAPGGGGGIANNGGTLTVTNSTFSGNSAAN
jgi:CSLREA domain-containing protein